MISSTYNHNMIAHLTVVFISALLFLITPSHSLDTVKSNPFHLSWTPKNQSRFDLIFSIKSPLKNVITLESLAANSTIERSLLSCTGYNACLLQDGNFILAYNVSNSNKGVEQNYPATYRFIDAKSKQNGTCLNGREITLFNHCSTHWNPPVHLRGDKDNCRHTINWHSPYSCHLNTTNYEHPCYTYDNVGNLIDLTPWILSNGSSYTVDTGVFNKTVRQFNLNICNDAHHSCSPNVAACYSDGGNTIESGFNNLTSIRYDDKDRTVLLTSLGQYDTRCTGKRVRTVVRFVCKNKIVVNPRPRLIRNDACESIIEWQTIHACPFSEISAPATKCAIKYEPLNIDINLRELIKNANSVEVNDIVVNNQRKTMILGLCQGIPKTKMASCGGKQFAITAACLLDADSKSSAKKSTRSEQVSSITNSNIRLVDSRLYLESYSPKETCQVAMGRDFNATSRVGARIEFFCSPENFDKPRFIGIEECVYVFEWGWQSMCLESLGVSKNVTLVDNTTSVVKPISATVPVNNSTKLSDKELKIDLSENMKPSQEAHKEIVEEAKKVIDTSVPEKSKVIKVKDHEPKSVENHLKPSTSKPTSAPPARIRDIPMNSNRMDKLHKFFMISLIVMSLAAFIVVIFILDKKTQLRIPLTNIRRHARQAFQPPPVPYTRVDQFNDLDL